jgi:RNA polymerase sigma factor (sigma-70 family)
MTGDKGKSPTLTAAIRRVLSGDVESYEVIHKHTDGPLRLHVARRHGLSVDDDFVKEVAIRTHEYVLNHLRLYNSDRGAAFQRWMEVQSLNVAREVVIERRDLHRLGSRGERKYVDLGENFDEELHPRRACPRPGPAEVHEAQERSRCLWQAFEELVSEGRLSVALYDIEGLTLSETATRLDKPLISVRRQLERSHDWLREQFKRQDVRPVECEPYYGRVRYESDDTGYDDDWTASVMAELPDDPDTLVGSAAEEAEEEVT